MEKKTNICASTYCRVLLRLFISILMTGSLLIFLIGQLQAQEPTCTQPEDVDITLTFCEAAHDDLADEYTPPLANVRTNGFIPPIILKAMGWYETQDSSIGGWAQCVNSVPYSSASGCDWGIMQINTGMNCSAPQDQFNAETQQQVKYDASYNIAIGAKILRQKWDWHRQNGRIIGNGSADVAEHWYYATWSYNKWNIINSPDNLIINPCPNWPTNWTGCAYQDRVWWTAAHPPTRKGHTLWSAVNLTRPDPVVIDFPATQPEMDAWTMWRISDTLPIHRDSCRAYLPIILKNWNGLKCKEFAKIWYPAGTNACDPSVSNCADGGGQPDKVWAGPWSTGYHQVEFLPQLVLTQTVIGAYWKSYEGVYGDLYIEAKLNGEWSQVHTSLSQSTTEEGRWEQVGLGEYADKYISGLRLGFSTSVGTPGHKFMVDGYRIVNFIRCTE